MTGFYVTVYNGVDSQEYFTVATSKKHAMIKGIQTHRICFPGNDKTKLTATARVA